MSTHHDRVRAVLLVHGLEADRRFGAGEQGDTVVRLTARVARIQAALDGVRDAADADRWMLAVYDAALVELCAALGLPQSLVDDTACPDCERRRVELELLSSVLPLG
jgi:hypothetical protein